MLITVISIVLLIFSLLVIILDICEDNLAYNSILYKINKFINNEKFIPLWVTTLLISAVSTALCIVLLINYNLEEKDTIYDNKIKYYDICNKAENVVKNSTEEELVKSKIIEWNHEVLKYKSGYNNPWISWFYNKEVLDNMEYIEYPGIEVPEEIR